MRREVLLLPTQAHRHPLCVYVCVVCGGGVSCRRSVFSFFTSQELVAMLLTSFGWFCFLHLLLLCGGCLPPPP